MMALLDPMPQQDPIGLDGQQKPIYMGGRWLQWLYNAITTRLGLCPYRIGFVQLKTQTAAINATAIAGTSGGGRVQVNWYLRVTTGDAAATLQLKVLWTEGSTVLNLLSTQLNPPAAGNVVSGVAFLELDASAPVSYAVLYSNPGGPIVYRLTVHVQAMP